MWRGIFMDLLSTVGLFMVAFMIGRGFWPSKYSSMKRRWADARAEAKYLREQLDEMQKKTAGRPAEDIWESGGDDSDR